MFFYFLGLGILLTWLLIFFYSPFKTTLGQFIFKGMVNNNEDFDRIIFFKNSFLGKLISCYICTSFWSSLAIGIALKIIFNLGILFVFTAWLTYPALAYIYKKIID